MSLMIQSTPTRKLGYWETICKFAHDLFGGTGNVVAMVEVQGQIAPSILQQALASLYQHHPALQAVIVEQSHEYYLKYSARFEDIPITLQHHAGDWQSAIEKLMSEKFPVHQYLWRAEICIAPNHVYIMICAHHAIADGMSLVSALNQLLTLYAALLEKRPINLKMIPTLHPIEDRLINQPDWESFLTHKEQCKPKAIHPWDFAKYVPLTQRHTRLIYKNLNSQSMAKLKHSCQLKNVTVNSILNATLLLAVQRNLNQALHTTLHTAINLRSYCEPPISTEQIGCFISMVLTEHKLDQQTHLWDIAKQYQQQLHTNIPLLGFCPSNFSIANFDITQLMQLFDMSSSSKRKHFTCGFAVSNLGQLPEQTTLHNAQIKKFLFCTNRVIGDFVIFVNVTTYQAEMHFCFCYVEPLVERQWVEKVITDFMKILGSVEINP